MNVFELLRIHVSFEKLPHNMLFLSLFGGCIKDDFVDIETCFWWAGQFGKFEHFMFKCAPFSMKLRLSFHAVWPLLLTRWLLQPFGAIGLFLTPAWLVFSDQSLAGIFSNN